MSDRTLSGDTFSSSYPRSKPSALVAFSHRVRFLFNGIRTNKSPSRYGWQKRPRWYGGGGQEHDPYTLTDKEIGGFTLTALPGLHHTTSTAEGR